MSDEALETLTEEQVRLCFWRETRSRATRETRGRLIVQITQASTIRSYRNMYREQLAIKKRGPVPPRAQNKADDSAEAAAERRVREPLEKMHAELEKMTSWPSFRDATRTWDTLEAGTQRDRRFCRESVFRSRERGRVFFFTKPTRSVRPPATPSRSRSAKFARPVWLAQRENT